MEMRVDKRCGDKRARGVDFLRTDRREMRFDRGKTPAFDANVHEFARRTERRASNDQVHGVVLLLGVPGIVAGQNRQSEGLSPP
jgi:hypothetical protein